MVRVNRNQRNWRGVKNKGNKGKKQNKKPTRENEKQNDREVQRTSHVKSKLIAKLLLNKTNIK